MNLRYLLLDWHVCCMYTLHVVNFHCPHTIYCIYLWISSMYLTLSTWISTIWNYMELLVQEEVILLSVDPDVRSLSYFPSCLSGHSSFCLQQYRTTKSWNTGSLFSYLVSTLTWQVHTVWISSCLNKIAACRSTSDYCNGGRGTLGIVSVYSPPCHPRHFLRLRRQ